jgi:TonB-linked SusC/RagA family outer membrane protein
MAFSANSYLQSTKLSLDIDNATVKEVMNAIEDQSEFLFFYQEEHLKLNRRVSIHVTEEDIHEILSDLYAGTNNFYIVNDRQIVIGEAPVNKLERHLASVEGNSVLSLQQPRKNEVAGKVTDTEGDPLPGVTITILGTSRGVITDDDGTYQVAAEPSDKLVFSFIGMESQIIDVGAQNTINIEMEEKTTELEDVTVVAFGKQKKESVVGSISTVDSRQLEKVASSDITTALAGKVAGIIAYDTGGEPGEANSEFFIRGVTTFGYKVDPLILIDGVEQTQTDLRRLQKDDIASFSILKDATATALYGARGANGVIMVETKSGVEGPTKISFRYEQMISQPTQEVEFADPITYMSMANNAVITRDPLAIQPYSQRKIENTANNVNPIAYPQNDWKEQLFKDYATSYRMNLSASGGGKVARYYVAGGYNKDGGILKNNGQNNFNNNIDLKSYSLRANVDVNLFKNTELTVRLDGSFDDYTGPLDGGSGMYNKVVRSNPVLFPPYFPVSETVNPEYRHVQHIMFGNAEEGNYINPYADMVKGYRDYSRSRMTAQMVLKQDLNVITEGLKARVMINTNRYSYFENSRAYQPYFYGIGYYNQRENYYTIEPIVEGEESIQLVGSGRDDVSSNFYLEAITNYARTINDKHNISSLLVFHQRHSVEADPSDLQASLPYRNLGLAGRATYSYDSRYFVEFNFGYNGSERFDKKNRFGFFPSVGAGWTISNESFWATMKDKVEKVKLRGSYGVTGNDAIGAQRFFYLANVNVNDGSYSASFGRNPGSYTSNGISIVQYPNPSVTWEKAYKTNLALELGMFKSINIIAEYFEERRTEILMPRASIPQSMGLQSDIVANVGEAKGSGVDISADYKKYWNNEMWLTVLANFTYATNEYITYEEPNYSEFWRQRVGYSIQQNRGYIAERLFVDDAEALNSPEQPFGPYGGGDIKYTDVNKDGIISSADMVPIGNPTTPEIVYGFGFSYGYKSVDISAFFQGLSNRSFWVDPVNTAPFHNGQQVVQAYADSYWSENNSDVYALWPRLTYGLSENNSQPSTWFMRDGTFLRLKQVELGYTLSDSILDKLNLDSFRFYLSANNLFSFTKFKMWDVEMGGNGLGYPIQRTLSMGINLTY